VSLRGSYGVQLQPVLRAGYPHHCVISGLVASGDAHCAASREYFHASLWPDSGHADLFTI